MQPTLTHEEARRLIQFNADRALIASQRKELAAHLNECRACRMFAPLMKRHWDVRPIPLPLSLLSVKPGAKKQTKLLLTMRKVILAVIFGAFVFGAWQLRVSSPPNSGTTRTAREACELLPYTIRQGDALDSVARRCSVAKEEIMALNEIETETITASMKLVIPLCSFTPTGTAEDPAALTRTNTPGLSPAASTPGG